MVNYWTKGDKKIGVPNLCSKHAGNIHYMVFEHKTTCLGECKQDRKGVGTEHTHMLFELGFTNASYMASKQNGQRLFLVFGQGYINMKCNVQQAKVT